MTSSHLQAAALGWPSAPHRTVVDERLARLNDEFMGRWRRDLCERLRQVGKDGEVTQTMADDVLAEQLLTMALGIQVLACYPMHRLVR